jgi:Protein of unknown function (DUF3435)
VRTYDDTGAFVGGFAATVQFVFTKHKRESLVQKKLKFTLLTPKDARLIAISPTYRLLSTLLKRGFLKHYETAAQLMNDDRHQITISKQALSIHVFCKATSGGKRLELGEAAKAVSFTPYLSRVALLYGYPEESTFYSWRKNHALDGSRSLGHDAERKLMGHASDSTILEDHYDDELADVDVFGMISGEGQDKAAIRRIRSEAVQRAHYSVDARSRKQLVDRWVETQPAIQDLRLKGLHSTTSPQLRAELHRLRALGEKAICRWDREQYLENRTRSDVQRRLGSLENQESEIFRMISEHVAAANLDPDVLREDDEQGDMMRDAEDDMKIDGDETDEEIDESPASICDLPANMPQLVQAFLEYLVGSKAPRLDSGEPRKCQLCIDDETTSQEEKATTHISMCL